jgi:hypothetical protein
LIWKERQGKTIKNQNKSHPLEMGKSWCFSTLILFLFCCFGFWDVSLFCFCFVFVLFFREVSRQGRIKLLHGDGGE